MSTGTLGWPLVIDLDGTLIKTNSLDETALDALRCEPIGIWKPPFKLLAGTSGAEVLPGRQVYLDVETWPVRRDFLDYVERHLPMRRSVPA